MVLEDDDIEAAGLDCFDGGLTGEMEGQGLSSGVDEGELSFGVGRGFDETGDCFADAAGVAVTDEEDFLRGVFGVNLREERSD